MDAFGGMVSNSSANEVQIVALADTF